MPGPTDRSPRQQEEVQLLEAGMGKRTVTVLENASHDEVIYISCAVVDGL